MKLARKAEIHISHAAFCRHDVVRLPGAPDGPLRGLNFAVQDAFSVEGVRCCFGNPAWLASHEPAERTAVVIARLLAAGATLTGLTQTDELALTLSGKNAHYGCPPNPARFDRVPGGSAAGSAVAVAAGQVDFALGTDAGGSVRVPAGHCGLFGMRPSHGAVSMKDVWPLAPRFDTVGWLCRTPRLLREVGNALLPASGLSVPFTQLLVPLDTHDLLSNHVWRVFAQGADHVQVTTGLPLTTGLVTSPETGSLASWRSTYVALQNEELRQCHGEWIELQRPHLGAMAGKLVTQAMTAPPVTDAIRAHAESINAAMHALLSTGSVLVIPTAAGAAPPRRESDDHLEAFTEKCSMLCAIASLAGLPQISLPVGTLEGCPFGVSVVGPRGSDRELLQLVQRFSALPAN
ncbi:MAG: amidase [Deltaproteobacteria bacterium]|nr:amidase [Deltaproteobacteria bacterium]